MELWGPYESPKINGFAWGLHITLITYRGPITISWLVDKIQIKPVLTVFLRFEAPHLALLATGTTAHSAAEADYDENHIGLKGMNK